MRQYIKNIMALTLGLLVVAGCADTDIADFVVEKPKSVAEMEYLNEYEALKTYIDRNASPNFKLGAGVTVSEYLDQGLVYSLMSANFDEMTAGNAMKYNSIVGDNGAMDFGQVSNFVDVARSAGLTIYGHTLAWHSQQNNKYLNGLLADKEIEVDPNEKVDVEDAFVDYSTFSSYPFYRMSDLPIINAEGQLEITNTEALANWQVQYFVADGVATKVGSDYKVTALIKGSADGSLNVNMGDWGGSVSSELKFTTEWTEVEIKMIGVPAASSFVVFQSGGFVGTLQVKWLKVSHSEAPVMTILTDLITNGDCEGDDTSCFYSTEITVGPNASNFGAPGTGADGVGRAIVVKSGDNPTNSWDTQFFVKVPRQLAEGTKYHFTMKYKAAKAAGSESQAHNNPGGYQHWAMLSPNPSFTTEWQEKTWIGSISGEQAGAGGMNTIAFNLAVLGEANTYYFDDIKFEIEESANTIPLTPEEKKEIVTLAMDNWVKGMMGACEGYVTTWDVVNEAISGRDVNGDGFYELQSAVQGTVSEDDAKNNFYWQDYMGDIDYVRTTIKLARQYYEEFGGNPSNLKLFINDYNLESDWDDNKKLKSLINWIARWEEDGTVVDGIGTQMHVSYHANAATQKSKEDHIVKMYELMAATGKLVKVSELDMGYVDENGNSVLTENMTEEQHKAMADYYKFIIQKYFEIIPANQQYGITQWAVTDSPKGSGWRGGEPIGLWDLNYSRKHTYAGFTDGLSRK
ncbi:endo-1,4-beta-xylanase [Bacteroides sp. OttesenSCG-928-D19]|nr:endo-1,4-beta-xylanase [Bacteroides sp. OttesenSCG-928-D19]